MSRALLLAAGVLLWSIAIYGATQIHRLDLPIGHGICGPWGCAAQPEALLGYHLFWLTLLGPAVSLGVRAAPREWSGWMAYSTLLVGGIGLLGIAIGAAGAWIVEGEPARYALQRGLFVVATTPDAPCLPLLLAGVAALPWALSGRRTTLPEAVPEGAGVAAQPPR